MTEIPLGSVLPMTEPNFLLELLDYVGFTEADARTLVDLRPLVEPAFDGIVDRFYEAIAAHPRARAVFKDGEPQIERQKVRLRQWLEQLFAGVYDEAYFHQRARIGRVHVQNDLPQHFMLTSMNVIRLGLHSAIDDAAATPSRRAGHRAVDRICDVELAIMLETYRERFVEQQRARERLATLGQLAASVGHELRNPLAVLSTSMHLLRRRVTDPKALRHVDKAERQIRLAERIVQDLLSMIRDRPPQREAVELDGLVEEILEGLPANERVRVETRLDPDLPELWFDRLQIRQVIANLLANAGAALEGVEGTIVITARLEDDRLSVEVLDDGPGIDPDVKDRLFEPLVTTRDTGVGLGLALCKRIVERHGGTIGAEDRPEGGTRVGFSLPHVRSPDDGSEVAP